MMNEPDHNPTTQAIDCSQPRQPQKSRARRYVIIWLTSIALSIVRAATTLGHLVTRALTRRVQEPPTEALAHFPMPVKVDEPAEHPAPDIAQYTSGHDFQSDTEKRPTLTTLWPDVDLITAPARRGDWIDRVLELLQEAPRAKMLDFRSVDVLDLTWFDRLVDGWPAPSGSIRRLAIVLDYERWAIWSIVIQRKLLRLTERGVEADVFYAQQAHRLRRWFIHGEVVHNLPAVLGWLRHDWQRPSQMTAVTGVAERPALGRGTGLGSDESWTIVLRRTAAIIDAHADVGHIPGLRMELATIARAFGSLAGNTEALSHLSVALYWLGDTPSHMKARVLRSLAMIKLDQGEMSEAITRLDAAVTVAMKAQDPTEAVHALLEIGRQAIRSGQHEGAEIRLRKALALMTNEQASELRATVHHLLAKALLGQGKNREETVRHARAALALRGAMSNATNEGDQALLDDIEARVMWFHQPSSTERPGL